MKERKVSWELYTCTYNISKVYLANKNPLLLLYWILSLCFVSYVMICFKTLAMFTEQKLGVDIRSLHLISFQTSCQPNV